MLPAIRYDFSCSSLFIYIYIFVFIYFVLYFCIFVFLYFCIFVFIYFFAYVINFSILVQVQAIQFKYKDMQENRPRSYLWRPRQPSSQHPLCLPFPLNNPFQLLFLPCLLPPFTLHSLPFHSRQQSIPRIRNA